MKMLFDEYSGFVVGVLCAAIIAMFAGILLCL